MLRTHAALKLAIVLDDQDARNEADWKPYVRLNVLIANINMYFGNERNSDELVTKYVLTC